MKKTEKLELEIMAIQLWWQSFGKTGLSEEKHRLYMSEKLNILKEELIFQDYLEKKYKK
jgi:hypothetical protein